jgi:hypothetical protein
LALFWGFGYFLYFNGIIYVKLVLFIKKYTKMLFLTCFPDPLEMAGFSHFLRTAQNCPFLGIFTILITFSNKLFYILLLILLFYKNKPNLGLFWSLPKKGPKTRVVKIELF